MGTILKSRTSVGYALERDGPRVRTKRGWYVDVTGGQHALLFSRLPLQALSHLVWDARDFIGVNRFLENESAEELGDWIANYDGTPGLQSYFVSGGTEAFEIALALVQHIHAETGNSTRGAVLGLSESYHGYSIAALNAGDHPVHRSRLFQAADLHWPKLARARLSSSEDASRALEEIFEREPVAAMVIEPIGGTTSGAVVIDDQVLNAICAACRRHNVLLVTDEVVTGFGRTGDPFCVRGDGFDIRLSGKLLGGGIVPICAVSVSSRVAAILEACSTPPPLRLTYAGNAFAAKTALALQRLRSQAESFEVQAKGAFLRSALEDQLGGFSVWIRGKGLLLAVVYECREPATFLRRVVEAGAAMGVLLMGGICLQPESMHLMVTPALDSTTADLEATADAVARVLRCVVGGSR